MEFNIEKALEYFEKQNNITEAAKQTCLDQGIPYQEKYRHRLSRKLIADVADLTNNYGINDLENETTTETNQYQSSNSNLPSAWSNEMQKYYSIEEYCIKYGLDISTVNSSKLVSHNQSHMVYNIAFKTLDEFESEEIQESIEDIIKKFIKPIDKNIVPKSYLKKDWFDRLVYTDTHLAMNVQGKDGDALYNGKWDKKESLKRLSLMIEHVKTFQSSDTLYIDDLGDFMDGLGAETTRKGHHLPQNMNDKEAFNLGLEFKITLVEELLKDYKFIICNDITNDNHSGVFSYFISTAVKGILEVKYADRVKVNTIKKFIDNYSVDKHTFVITHGKDMGENKFGFKPFLDPVQIEKLDQYCKENNLYNGNYIEVSKGDSHRGLYDDTTSNDFHYYNYPAFSPPSNWVKTNFKNSKSGFRFYNISREENIKVAIPYFFEKH
jgi:hypothetical protein